MRSLIRSPKPTAIFGLSYSQKAVESVNTESSTQTVSAVGGQHLAALSLMHSKVSGIRKLRNDLTSLGREPTPLETTLLMREARGLINLEAHSFESFLKPAGTYNAEAEEDELEGDELAPEAPTESESESPEQAAAIAEGEENEVDEGVDSEPAPEAPTEPPIGDLGETTTTETTTVSEGDPITEEVEEKEPEHKVNVVMREGEVEINIESAFVAYSELEESFKDKVRATLEGQFNSTKSEIESSLSRLKALRSEVATAACFDFINVPVPTTAKHYLFSGVTGGDVTEQLNNSVNIARSLKDYLLNNFYLNVVQRAVIAYEEGNFADANDILISGTQVFSKGNFLTVGDDGLLQLAGLNNSGIDHVDVSSTALTTVLNNEAISIAQTLLGSTFMSAHDELAKRMELVKEKYGEEAIGDNSLVNNFSYEILMKVSAVLHAINQWLNAVVEFNQAALGTVK